MNCLFPNSAEVKQLSRLLGVSEVAIRRMLESLIIPIGPDDSRAKEGSKREHLNLGFRLSELDLSRFLHCRAHLLSAADTETRDKVSLPGKCDDCKAQRRVVVELLCRKITEFKGCCAPVANWINRGDFSAGKIPVSIKFQHVLHACRTISRLRSSFVRDLEREPK